MQCTQALVLENWGVYKESNLAAQLLLKAPTHTLLGRTKRVEIYLPSDSATMRACRRRRPRVERLLEIGCISSTSMLA